MGLIIKKFVFVTFLSLLLFQCQGTLLKTEIFESTKPIERTDKIFILPVSIINDISLSNKEVAQMYENLTYTILKKNGYKVVSVDEMIDLFKNKKNDIEEIRKIDLKEINRETIDKLKELKAVLIIKPGIVAYPKEGITALQNIFMFLKFYQVEENSLSLINLSYEGEESIYSNKMISIFRGLLEKWIDVNDALIKKNEKK